MAEDVGVDQLMTEPIEITLSDEDVLKAVNRRIKLMWMAFSGVIFATLMCLGMAIWAMISVASADSVTDKIVNMVLVLCWVWNSYAVAKLWDKMHDAMADVYDVRQVLRNPEGEPYFPVAYREQFLNDVIFSASRILTEHKRGEILAAARKAADKIVEREREKGGADGSSDRSE